MSNRSLVMVTLCNVPSNEPSQERGLVGWTHAATSAEAHARRILRQLEELSTTRYVDPWVFAGIHAGLGCALALEESRPEFAAQIERYTRAPRRAQRVPMILHLRYRLRAQVGFSDFRSVELIGEVAAFP